MRCPHLETIFENLGEHDYDRDRVSPADLRYNCIAWAAGENHRRWWPIRLGGYWWPPQLPPEDETLENFIRAFELLGYRKCRWRKSKLENGIEKIAIFVDDKEVPTHAARQLDSGMWTSKCGVQLEDIEHKTFAALEGRAYGLVAVFLKRRRDGKPFLADRIRALINKILSK